MTATPALRLLALDTSTDVLSLAVQAANGRIWQHEGPGSAQSSGTLLPGIAALLQEAGLALEQLDAIIYGCGPGSFTGLRTTCAVAQGLAFGLAMGPHQRAVPAVAVDSLMATAEDARQRHGCERVVAALDARMSEVYTATLRWQNGHWLHEGDIAAMAPAAVHVPPGYTLAGNAHQVYAQEMAPLLESLGTPAIPAMPRAEAMLRLAPQLLAAGKGHAPEAIAPLYIRNKVALTTEERERLKAGG